MFRTRKSEDPFIYRRPGARQAEEEPASGDSESSVASSALRWLTGSDQSVRAVDEDAKVAEPDIEAEDEALDVFDLTDPIDDADADKGSASQPAEDPPDEEPARNVSSDPAPDSASDFMNAAAGLLSPLEFDDDDDLDDFDEMPLLHLIEKPVPSPDEVDVRPRHDADDAVPATDHGKPALTTPSPDLTEEETEQVDGVEDTTLPSAQVEAEKTDEVRDVPDLQRDEPEAACPEPVAATPQPEVSPAKSSSTHSLEEAPATSFEASLALRPIPELQTGPRTAGKAGDKRSQAPVADRTIDGGEPTHAQADDDDIEAISSDDDVSPADKLDIAALELDSLDLESSDHADDQVGDDWHAHLADVLGNNDDVSPFPAEKPLPPGEPAKAVLPEAEPAKREDRSAPVVPLSRTLSKLAATNKPADEEVPEFSLLTRTARQKLAPSQPSAVSAETPELSLVQVSLGIVANVPRLRRFAAAQIGDEPLADRLVQRVAEKALADPSSVQPVSDLGLALIKLLYRHRESMLADPSAIDRSPQDSHMFETALCRGLAGADQFEMHQFAVAINRLDERDREFLILVNLENLTYDQVADIVQMPKERVMAMVSNARMRLRQALAADEAGTKDQSSTTIFTPHPQEIDIHGYLDGELDSAHMAEIDALVEHDEDAADRLVHYGIQGDLIRRLYAPLFNRPIPGSLLEGLSTAAKPARRGFRFGARRALITGAVVMVLSFGAIGSGIALALSGLFSEATTISSARLEQ